MDNYSLNDVKTINESNMLTDDILKKIIVSVLRRLEIYNDYSEIEILEYLRKSDFVNSEIKKEIDGYLYKFEEHIIEEQEKISSRKLLLIIPLIILILLGIFLLLWR